MFKTSRDRGYVVFVAAFLALVVGLGMPTVFFVALCALAFVGAFAVAFFIYDWIISADEVLAQEAEYRRERYQMTPSTSTKRGKYQEAAVPDATLEGLIKRAKAHKMSSEEIAEQRNPNREKWHRY